VAEPSIPKQGTSYREPGGKDKAKIKKQKSKIPPLLIFDFSFFIFDNF
jgi:hypothetical protein